MQGNSEIRIDYKRSRFVRWFTIGLGVVIVGIFVYFLISSGGTYLPAWFMTVAMAVLLLGVLSFPRYVKISPVSLEIHCIVDLTRIPLREIKQVRLLDRSEMKFSLPIFASLGFGGYFGHFFGFGDMGTFVMYATEWKNFVLIEDIYEDKYVISCSEPERLVELITERING